MTHSWNDKILLVAVIGNYQYEIPSNSALGTLDVLLQYMMDKNHLDVNFGLYAACQIHHATASPGRNLMKAISASEYTNIAGHRVSTSAKRFLMCHSLGFDEFAG